MEALRVTGVIVGALGLWLLALFGAVSLDLLWLLGLVTFAGIFLTYWWQQS